MRQYILIIIIFLFSLQIVNLHSQQSAEVQYSTRVKVDVTSDENESLFQSYLTRELRQLQGVVIVEDNPEWIINVVVVTDKDKQDRTVAYGIATCITQCLDKHIEDKISFIDKIEKTTPPPGIEAWEWKARLGLIKYFFECSKEAEVFRAMSVYYYGIQRTKELCANIVAKFDVNFLEKERQSLQFIKDLRTK